MLHALLAAACLGACWVFLRWALAGDAVQDAAEGLGHGVIHEQFSPAANEPHVLLRVPVVRLADLRRGGVLVLVYQSRRVSLVRVGRVATGATVSVCSSKMVAGSSIKSSSTQEGGQRTHEGQQNTNKVCSFTSSYLPVQQPLPCCYLGPGLSVSTLTLVARTPSRSTKQGCPSSANRCWKRQEQ